MADAALYQELILQHYRSTKRRGTIEHPDFEAAMNNPICGDQVTLQLSIREGRVAAARYQGHGCSLSQASASMMTQQVEGRTLAEAADLLERFQRMLGGDSAAAADPGLGDLRALAGVARFPARMKCALLPWKALEGATDRDRTD